MHTPNKVTEFFDHQYLWKETTNVLDFLYTVSNQGKILCKIDPVVAIVVALHAQACLDLQQLSLVGLGIVEPH